MKTTKIYTILIAALYILCFSTACKKDKPSTDREDNDVFFDVKKAEEYYIYVKTINDNQVTKHSLIDFGPDNSITLYVTQYQYVDAYTFTDNNTTVTINSSIANIVINKGKVASITLAKDSVTEFIVIKKEEVSSLVGKTFTGSYLKADGTVLHSKFFYRFIGDNKYEAGFEIANTLRTETYEPIGNIGAWVSSTSDLNHRELLLYVNDALKVTYMETEKKIHHGSFTEVK